MALITKSGRSAMAAAIKDKPLHMAWGRADPKWEAPQSLNKAFKVDDLLTLNDEGAFGFDYFHLKNGQFITDTAGWTGTDAGGTVSAGEVTVTSTGTNGFIYQEMQLEPAKRYRATCTARNGTGTSAKLQAADEADGSELGVDSEAGTSNVTLDVYFTTPASGKVFIRLIADGASGSTAIFDDVQVIDADDITITGVVVKSTDLATTYTVSTDYTVDPATGVITRVGSGAITSEQVVNVSFTLKTPPGSVYWSTLLDEIGRRTITVKDFVVPDEISPTISVPDGNFSVSADPTEYLYVYVIFDFTDADTETVRELAVMVDSATDGALPPGQLYFEGAEVTDPGILLTLQNVVPIVRSGASRETFEFVLQF